MRNLNLLVAIREMQSMGAKTYSCILWVTEIDNNTITETADGMPVQLATEWATQRLMQCQTMVCMLSAALTFQVLSTKVAVRTVCAISWPPCNIRFAMAMASSNTPPGPQEVHDLCRSRTIAM